MEQGSHAELITRPEGAYSMLVGLQMRALETQEDDGEKDVSPEEEEEPELVKDVVPPPPSPPPPPRGPPSLGRSGFAD